MRKILLINVDSAWNTAIRKYYTYFKAQPNTEVEMRNLGFEFYPKKHPSHAVIDASDYDEVYVSNIFEKNAYAVEVEGCDRVYFGGIGSRDPHLQLPEDVDRQVPYFNAKDDNGEFWTYLSRGCVRACWFCKVGKYEGKFRRCDTVENVLANIPEEARVVQFLDNNILGFGDDVIDIFNRIAEWQKTHNVKVCFNQGLDWRLVTRERLEAMMQLKWEGDYVFAFDCASYESALNDKIALIQDVVAKHQKNGSADWKIRFYLYHNDKEYTIKDLIHRVEWCRRKKAICYIMRDQNCYESEYDPFYKDYAAYCNLTAQFKKRDFRSFLIARHQTKSGVDWNRVNFSDKVFCDNISDDDWKTPDMFPPMEETVKSTGPKLFEQLTFDFAV